MKINSVKKDDVTSLVVEGKLDTNTAPQAQEALDELVEEGARKILLDFRSLDYISSAGLRVLLATAKKLRASGGALRLCNLNETVAEVFQISGFNAIFDLYPSEAEALEDF